MKKTRAGPARSLLHKISRRDSQRYTALAEAVADSERAMGEIQTALGHLEELTRRGERVAARGASIVAARHSLRFCAVPSTTAKEAADKVRFLGIVANWFLSRDLNLLAVLIEGRRQELQRWGLSGHSHDESTTQH